MALLVTYVVLALGVSFLCSILEAVLLSITPAHVASLRDSGSRVGERLHRMKEDIDRPLAAILSLNTIAHTVGAAGAGAQAVKVFGDAYIGVISAILTLLILFFSEIIPKTLGAVYWRTLAPVIGAVLVPVVWSMWPLVKAAELTRRLIVRQPPHGPVSREEVAAMARLGHAEGVMDEGESRMVESLLRFRSLRVRDVMTPRTVVTAFPEDVATGEVVAGAERLLFSRIPIYKDSLDDVTGYVLKDDVLLQAAEDAPDTPLSALRRELTVVPETLSLPRLFEQLLARGEQIALAIDERGGTTGLVTMEDVIETLLGREIVDEVDSVEDMQELARQLWRKRAAKLGLIEVTADVEGPEAAPGAGGADRRAASREEDP
ncbi:MAG TPA: hemolysin family protein [Thermoanaerobaculia bacterium]|nr:hemolysin family protein [Thermoanaerobaculia bacterium]